jgi:hypothetical protein
MFYRGRDPERIGAALANIASSKTGQSDCEVTDLTSFIGKRRLGIGKLCTFAVRERSDEC